MLMGIAGALLGFFVTFFITLFVLLPLSSIIRKLGLEFIPEQDPSRMSLFAAFLSSAGGFWLGSKEWRQTLDIDLVPGPVLGAVIGFLGGGFVFTVIVASIWDLASAKSPDLLERLKRINVWVVGVLGFLVACACGYLGNQYFG